MENKTKECVSSILFFSVLNISGGDLKFLAKISESISPL